MNFNRKTQDLKNIYTHKNDPLKFIIPNATVWIKLSQPDENMNIFKKALVIFADLAKDIVRVRFLEVDPQKKKSYEDYKTKHVFKVNSLYRPQGYDDMVRMVIVNEAETIYNLKNRFCQDIHYTYINEVLVFLNSKTIPPGLYSKTNMSFYKKMLQSEDYLNAKDFLPHIYGEISEAMKSIERKNQVLIFQGESNSGKTLNFVKAAEFLSILNKESKENKGIGEYLDLSGLFIISSILIILRFHAYRYV